MFTGLVTDVGEVNKINRANNLMRISVATNYDLKKIDIGASIACNGCCLTVVEKKTEQNNNILDFELSSETLQKTIFSRVKENDLINLEKSLTLGAELGGHIVTGHVDFVATVKNIEIQKVDSGENWIVTFSILEEFAKFIATKGSVCVNGVSLTVNEASMEDFSINIIPHTLKNTAFQNLKTSDKVNIEIDVIARYLNNLLEKRL